MKESALTIGQKRRARIRELVFKGNSASEIAESLGLPLEVVETDMLMLRPTSSRMAEAARAKLYTIALSEPAVIKTQPIPELLDMDDLEEEAKKIMTMEQPPPLVAKAIDIRVKARAAQNKAVLERAKMVRDDNKLRLDMANRNMALKVQVLTTLSKFVADESNSDDAIDWGTTDSRDGS